VRGSPRRRVGQFLVAKVGQFFVAVDKEEACSLGNGLVRAFCARNHNPPAPSA